MVVLCECLPVTGVHATEPRAAIWPHFIAESSAQLSWSQSEGIVESLKEELHDFERTQPRQTFRARAPRTQKPGEKVAD